MARVIINADDCGITSSVNEAIKHYIEEGLISSSTIMANMEAFDGAVQLYKDFHHQVSFGVHFNLTEGEPLTDSQLLLEKGLFKEENGKIVFNGRNYNFKTLTKEMMSDVRKELIAQADKIMSSGIKPSHIDSHHHIHWQAPLIPLFAELASLYGNNKIRKQWIKESSISISNRMKIWLRESLMKWNNMKIKTVDDFVSVEYFLKKYNNAETDNQQVVELMLHPGHPYESYREQTEKLWISFNHGNNHIISYYYL